MNRTVYTITHPETKGVGTCQEEALPAWLALGWVLVDEPATTLDATATQTFPARKKEAKAGLLSGKTVTTPVVNLNQESPGLDLEETI